MQQYRDRGAMALPDVARYDDVSFDKILASDRQKYCHSTVHTMHAHPTDNIQSNTKCYRCLTDCNYIIGQLQSFN